MHYYIDKFSSFIQTSFLADKIHAVILLLQIWRAFYIYFTCLRVE